MHYSPHPDQWVDTTRGRVRAGWLKVGDQVMKDGGTTAILGLVRRELNEWAAVIVDGVVEPLLVTMDHHFVLPDKGGYILARDLKLCTMLAGSGKECSVNGLRLRYDKARSVSIHIAPPHLYYLRNDGPLSYNPEKQ